jgi:ribonuclease PH
MNRPFARPDGRAAPAMRPLRIEPSPLKHPPGSALIELGDTRVLCSAFVEHVAPHFIRMDPRKSGGGWVTAEYGMLPGSSAQRVGRERHRGGRAEEISRLIGRSLRATVDMRAMGEHTLTVDCDVLQADGGTRTAAVTGGFVAMALALARMRGDGVMDGWPLRHMAAAVSVGLVGGTALLDLSYAEDARAEADLNVVKNEKMDFIEVQGTAEENPFGDEDFRALLRLADAGLAEILKAQRAALAGLPAACRLP